MKNTREIRANTRVFYLNSSLNYEELVKIISTKITASWIIYQEVFAGFHFGGKAVNIGQIFFHNEHLNQLGPSGTKRVKIVDFDDKLS